MREIVLGGLIMPMIHRHKAKAVGCKRDAPGVLKMPEEDVRLLQNNLCVVIVAVKVSHPTQIGE
jgi:hypothetical protein